MEEWRGGREDGWLVLKIGVVMDERQNNKIEKMEWISPRRNVNRGYRKLRVWEDAVDYYVQTCAVFRAFQYEIRRVGANQIASVDSIHRNIAEGYCRRSIREYLQFLNYAMASAGESVSALHAYRKAEQINSEQFEVLDASAYKIENGLKRLIESLQQKQYAGDWNDTFIVQESNELYLTDSPEEYK